MVLTDEVDLFVFKEDPLVDVEDELGESFFIILRNFDHNFSTLKPLHKDVLRDRVVGFLANTTAGFAEIYAMTDRSGTRAVNYKVSGLRLIAVQEHLKSLNAPPAKVKHAFTKAIGEDFFEDRFNRSPDPAFKNDRKDGQFRNVTIALTPAPIGVPTKIFRSQFLAETLRFCRQHVQQR